MGISIIISVVSALLFLYWCRYIWVLLFGKRKVRNYAQRVAEVNNLNFLAAREQLAHAETAPEIFDQLDEMLERDYRVLSYLLRHVETDGAPSIMEYLLRLDYRFMCLCYRVARPFSRTSAQQALLQRASIIGHLANAMGERVAS